MGCIDHFLDACSTTGTRWNKGMQIDEINVKLDPDGNDGMIRDAVSSMEGAKLLDPQSSRQDVTVNFNDPTSILSYALSSKQYEEWIADQSTQTQVNIEDVLDIVNSAHLRISFGYISSSLDRQVNCSLTCYYAKQFNALRRRCCPSHVDFAHSLSESRRWSNHGVKNNVYLARSLDERFIIKQVTETQLKSFERFGPAYFEHLVAALSEGRPTCLVKVLGIYQVTVKQSNGGKNMKMNLMVMENLFFGRSVSRAYEYKSSELSDIDHSDITRGESIFLGIQAKRELQRAVWNDTVFLSSASLVDYSLLVGIDDESKELVIGLIDYFGEYTWYKQLQMWIMGILNMCCGSKKASPVHFSPKEYKKYFRKAIDNICLHYQFNESILKH